MAVKKRSNEIKIERIYDAPVKLVWEAWTDPEQVAKWWGPRGFTLTTHSKDLRPGGTWKYTMHGPDGKDWENITFYHEVEEYKKLVYDHGATENTPPLFRVTVLFEEVNGKTKMSMTTTLPTPEAAEEARKFIRKANGNSTWDRLAEYLDKRVSDKEKFVINWSFEAPLEKVYEMWSQPNHLTKWLARTGFRLEVHTGEIKPLETLLFNMTIEASARRAVSESWPETMLLTVTFSKEGSDQTRVTVECEPSGQFTANELDAFVKERAGMTEGWSGSFDKLEELLAN